MLFFHIYIALTHITLSSAQRMLSHYTLSAPAFIVAYIIQPWRIDMCGLAGGGDVTGVLILMQCCVASIYSAEMMTAANDLMTFG